MKSSVAIHIGFYHKPSNGKSLVYDPSSSKWKYIENPTVTQISVSESKFADINLNADNAFFKAQSAESKAVDAMSAAASKVTAAEAVEAARNDMFTISTLDDAVSPFRTIEFIETVPGRFEVVIHKGLTSGAPTSANTGGLAYASQEEVDDIHDRLLAIEQRLGISS